jgi:hypothetical protein
VGEEEPFNMLTLDVEQDSPGKEFDCEVVRPWGSRVSSGASIVLLKEIEVQEGSGRLSHY